MLEADDLDADTRSRYLRIIKGRMDSLSTLMNNLFDYTKISEGSNTLEIEKVNVSNVLRDALSEAYAELQKKGFRVDVDIPDQPMYCFCNSEALQRVLQNLFKNVYTHGRESLAVRLAAGTITIANQVTDLSEADVEHLFERFYTADASRSNHSTGIGLTIAQELTEQMGGTLSATKDGDLLVMKVELTTTKK